MDSPIRSSIKPYKSLASLDNFFESSILNEQFRYSIERILCSFITVVVIELERIAHDVTPISITLRIVREYTNILIIDRIIQAGIAKVKSREKYEKTHDFLEKP